MTCALRAAAVAVAFALVGLANAGAQVSVRGIVLAADTEQPLPYVHVGTVAGTAGAITDEAGAFTLTVRPGDSLRASMIGYASATTIAPPPSASGEVVIRLEPRAYELVTASVRGRAADPDLLLEARPTRVTTGHSGRGDYGVGEEYCRLLALPPGEHALTGLDFHLRFNRLDSVLFRVTLYRIGADGLPAEPLGPAPTYAKATRKQQRVSARFEAPVRVDGEVAAAVEVVRLWRRKRGDNALFFSHAEATTKPSFHRAASQAAWRRGATTPFAMWVWGHRRS